MSISDKDLSASLFDAVQAGDRENAKLLLEQGANVNIADDRGMTPLYCALKSETYDHKMLELLMKYCPNIHGSGEKYAFSPLGLAYKSKSIDAISSLLRISREEAIQYLREVPKKKMLSHVNGIHGSFSGYYWNICAQFIVETLESMPAEMSSSLSAKEKEKLTQTFKNMLTKDGNEVESIQKGDLHFLAVGYVGHTIYLAFYKGYMVICNRAYKQTVTAYKIEPQLFTTEIYNRIFDISNSKRSKETLKFYYRELPALLAGSQDEVCEQLELLAPKKQKGGVCAYASGKVAVRVGAAMLKIDEELVTPTLFSDDRRAAHQFAKNFSTHARFKALDEHYASDRYPWFDYDLVDLSHEKAFKHSKKSLGFSLKHYPHVEKNHKERKLFKKEFNFIL